MGGDNVADTGLEVEIEAEDDLGRCFRWRGLAPLEAPIRELARRWAVAHELPVESVGFTELEEEQDPTTSHSSSWQPLDLAATPAGLGWSARPGRAPRRLAAVPLLHDFAEAPNVRQTRQSAKNEALVLGVDASASGAARRGRKRAAEIEVAASGAKRASPAGPKRSGGACIAKDGGSAAAAAHAGGRYAGFAGDPLPANEAQIVYQQENPKKAGTAGWTRYESYKAACTLDEALTLGAAKGDLTHDWKKGFIRRA